MYPEGIDTDAPVIARHSTTIAAPPSLVCLLHTDIDAWPSWQKAIDEAAAKAKEAEARYQALSKGQKEL